MTNKRAIEFIKTDISRLWSTPQNLLHKEALEMAIKALEQEPILDKIREEIKGWQIDIHDNENDADKHDFVFERIFEIIDEYKAESEDRNGKKEV